MIHITPFMIGWQRRWWSRNEFHWRWSVPGVALALVVAFASGLLFFGERTDLMKTLAVLGILVEIVLTVLV